MILGLFCLSNAFWRVLLACLLDLVLISFILFIKVSSFKVTGSIFWPNNNFIGELPVLELLELLIERIVKCSDSAQDIPVKCLIAQILLPISL